MVGDRSEELEEDLTDRLPEDSPPARCSRADVFLGLRSGDVSFSAMLLTFAGRGPTSSLSTLIHAASRMRAMHAEEL